MRKCALALLLLSVVWGAAGCAFKFRDYEPLSRAVTADHPTVRITIANPDAPFKMEGFIGDVKKASSTPSVADYVHDALEKELKAAGFAVVLSGDHDVLLRVHIRDLVFAQVIPFWLYPLPIGYGKQAAIVDLNATVRLTGSQRVFQRRFANVAHDGYFWFFAPLGQESPPKLVQDSAQACFSELVKAIAALMKNPDGQNS